MAVLSSPSPNPRSESRRTLISTLHLTRQILKRLISWIRSSASTILARTLDMSSLPTSTANKSRAVNEEEQTKFAILPRFQCFPLGRIQCTSLVKQYMYMYRTRTNTRQLVSQESEFIVRSARAEYLGTVVILRGSRIPTSYLPYL